MSEMPRTPLQQAVADKDITAVVDIVYERDLEIRKLEAEIERLRADNTQLHQDYRIQNDEIVRCHAEIERLRNIISMAHHSCVGVYSDEMFNSKKIQCLMETIEAMARKAGGWQVTSTE